MQRRSIVAAISIFVHAIVLVMAMTADLWTPVSGWPTPRSAMAFIDPPRSVRLEDIPLTPAAVTRSTPGAAAPSLVSRLPIDLAPVVPPATVGDESIPSGFTRTPGEAPGAGELKPFGLATPPAPPQLLIAAPQAPIRLHSGIRAPQRTTNVAPVYPVIARSAHVEGVVIIETTIDEHGNVVRTQLLRSIPMLDDAALTAVRQWKFSPTLLNGVPVPIVMTVTVNFTLAQ